MGFWWLGNKFEGKHQGWEENPVILNIWPYTRYCNYPAGYLAILINKNPFQQADKGHHFLYS